MLSFQSLLLCLALSAGVSFFLRQRRVSEHVNNVAQDFCRRNQVQFLDGTVECRKMRWNRSTDSGRWQFYRLYLFEFSSDNVERGYGAVVFEGGKVRQINFVDDQQLH